MPHTPNLLIRPSGYSVHFLSMTAGEPHPTAKLPSLSLPGRRRYTQFSSLSITSCRFAVLVGSTRNQNTVKILVWDWRKGKLLLVSEFCSHRVVAHFGLTRIGIIW